MKSLRPAALLLLVMTLSLVGCSADAVIPSPAVTATPTPSPTTAQQQVIVAMLAADDAQPTMSKAQRATLLDVLATGEVTFEQYQEAITNTLECAEDAGLTIDGPRTVDEGSQPTIQWGWNDPAQADGDPKLGEFCRNVHSLGVEQAYLNSDAGVENERRQLEEYRGEIVACYTNAGAPLSDPAMDIFDMLNNNEDLAGSHAESVTACLDDLNIVVSP